MNSISEQIQIQAEKSILTLISSGNWLQANCQDRVKLPSDFMEQVWRIVDQEKVKQQLANRLEEELANRIVNHMAAELATDIKQILSVSERREACRALARNHMAEIMAAGSGEKSA